MVDSTPVFWVSRGRCHVASILAEVYRHEQDFLN